MANKASSVVKGTAADEPSAHKTRFNRKKMPNINLQCDQNKLVNNEIITERSQIHVCYATTIN